MFGTLSPDSRDSVILQKYRSLSNQSFKLNSARMSSLDLTPELSFEPRFRNIIINGYYTKSIRLQCLVSFSKHFLKLHHRRYKDLPFLAYIVKHTTCYDCFYHVNQISTYSLIRILNQPFNAPKVLSTVITVVDKCLLKTFWCLGQFCLKGKGLTCHIVDGYALSLRIKDRTLNPSTLLVGCASLISFGLVNK